MIRDLILLMNFAKSVIESFLHYPVSMSLNSCSGDFPLVTFNRSAKITTQHFYRYQLVSPILLVVSQETLLQFYSAGITSVSPIVLNH